MAAIRDISEEELPIHSIENHDVGVAKIKIDLSLDVSEWKMGWRDDKLRRDQLILRLRAEMEDFARSLINELESKLDK